MSVAIFEAEPNPHDPLDGIDLLYGCDDGSGGKVIKFFRDLALSDGIDTQQSYARLGTSHKIPDYIESYCEQLVLKLHMRCPNRQAPAWNIAAEELRSCLSYLTILAEKPIVPLANLVTVDEAERIVWFMLPSGNMQTRAGVNIPYVEAYIRFCSDPSEIPDLSQRYEYYGEDIVSS